MNLIEQLGGYKRAKEFYKKFKDDSCSLNRQRALNVKTAMLVYRRQHNIFEVGDKVVSKENNEFVYTVITVDGGLGVLKNILFNHVYPLRDFRHATDAEIKAGKRLEVNDGN